MVTPILSATDGAACNSLAGTTSAASLDGHPPATSQREVTTRLVLVRSYYVPVIYKSFIGFSAALVADLGCRCKLA